MTRIREFLVDSPNSLGERARAQRAERLIGAFPDLPEMLVLDLGGTVESWTRLPFHPAHLTTLNPFDWVNEAAGDVPWHTDAIGDACDPPDEVMSQSYDLVFSNSTIEHVGDKQARRRFADVVHKVADCHWIQTPNRAFPVEPHVLFPLHQFLPRYGRGLVERYWPLVHTKWPTMEAALESADSTELLWQREMVDLFPDSRIEAESIVPFLPAKSLIAIKH